MLIFDELYPDEGDLLQQPLWRRREGVKNLQNFLFVCPEWAVSIIHLQSDIALTFNDNQEMVGSFLFRRAMATLYQTSKSDIVVRSLKRFVERFKEGLKPTESSEALKPSLRQIWLQRAWADASPSSKKGLDTFRQLIPQISGLSEIRIDNIDISVECFQYIQKHHAETLKRMAVSFDQKDSGKIIPLLDHFLALEELKLRTFSEDIDAPLPKIKRPAVAEPLPKLRSLGLSSGMSRQCLMEHFSIFELPELSVFEAGFQSRQFVLLTDFLTKHGIKLTTLRLRCGHQPMDFRIDDLTPKLEHLEVDMRSFDKDRNRDLLSSLRFLPTTVTSVTLGPDLKIIPKDFVCMVGALKARVPHQRTPEFFF